MDDAAVQAGLRRDRFLLAASLLIALAHLMYVFPQLPDRVVSHFDAQGRPDGSMSREAFAWTMVLTYALSGGSFLAIGALLRRVPASLVNVPNREYWLAPERREATLARLARRLVRLGAVTVVFVLVIVHGTVQFNLGRADGLDGLWLAVGAYCFYTLVWTLALVRELRLPPGAAGGGRDRVTRR